MQPSKLKHSVLIATLAGLAFATLPAAAESTASEPWAFTVTPYLWLPTINGSLKRHLPDFDLELETGPNDYLSDLELFLMVSGEARKGKWSIYTDLVYLDFSDESSHAKTISLGPISTTVDLGDTHYSLSGYVWTLAGGYAAVQNPQATLDVIGGFRHFNIEASAGWTLPDASGQLEFSQRKDLWDAIVGVRGRVKLGENSGWSMPYYADLGAGSSSLTWQAMAGVAYSWGWGDVGLVYRHLAYDMDDDKLLQDIEFSGPAVGAAFHF